MAVEQEQGTAIGAASKLSSQIVGALPPAFLLLVLLNMCFLGLVMWFLNSQMEQRVQIVERVLSTCAHIP